jgi:hypothetical protein
MFLVNEEIGDFLIFILIKYYEKGFFSSDAYCSSGWSYNLKKPNQFKGKLTIQYETLDMI